MVVFNHRVGQQPLAHLPNAALSLAWGWDIEVELQVFSHPHPSHPVVAQAVKGALDGMTLRVQDSIFRCNKNLDTDHDSDP